MIQVKNLVKVYKPKKGVPVKAIDNVTLTFPERGMVFLLGKSGSGKSTLLNLIGGLDRYTDGEIIIKGVSSRAFKQSHFDSYRNTYVGFIFQEYNILEEFTVGANIALAIELQGKKATDEQLNKILEEVDLAGYGARRPNELSGGQKQRVAIARALVKNPKIIMADEPTGALDSETGKQVLTTLKKLSKDKLVIVVSHDREFAETYADRIIELADGKVISDVTASGEELPAEEGISFENNVAKIPSGYHLTEADREAINRYIDGLSEGLMLEIGSKKTTRGFQRTDTSKISILDTSPFKLIKSKLALRHAFKIGASGLKHKKFRLVMTVLLSVIAFTLFGLVDTFSSYNHPQATANSIVDSNVTYATLRKSVKHGEGIDSFWSSYGNYISDREIAELSNETGVNFRPVLTGNYHMRDNYYDLEKLHGESVYTLDVTAFSGIVEIDNEVLDNCGYELVAGRLPDASGTEVAISSYVFDSFKKMGYRDIIESDGGDNKTEKPTDDEPSKYEFDADIEFSADIDIGGSLLNNGKQVQINSKQDLLGKKLRIENGMQLTIVGIVDTGFDISRYEALTEADENAGGGELILNYVLYAEFESAVHDSHTGMLMVGNGALTKLSSGVHEIDDYINLYSSDHSGFGTNQIAKLNDVQAEIEWFSGNAHPLAENEVLVSVDYYENRFGEVWGESGTEQADGKAFFKDSEFAMEYYDGEEWITREGVKVVGFFQTNGLAGQTYQTVILADSIADEFLGENDGLYGLALGIMPKDKSDIRHLAEICYDDSDGVKFELQNPASFELDSLHEMIETLSAIFIWVGLFFCIFAAVLLANFISTSISYKKQEIGILRAIGSRGNDVFRIFFAESFIIAVINCVLACIGTGVATAIINNVMREEAGILVTVLNFGIRQITLLFLISVGVAAIASFLPVKKIASKRPIDAIRNR